MHGIIPYARRSLWLAIIVHFVLYRKVVENPDPDTGIEEPLMEANSSDGLDARIEALLRDWHHSPDLLFSIHPVDGSYLIW